MNNTRIPVVLDTDAFNEVDDQFAIAYLLRSQDRLDPLALYAAPFSNKRAAEPGEGMEKSYREIGRLLRLMGEDKPFYRGSAAYLPDERTPVESEAARDLVRRCMVYTRENPLYVVGIGAITNVASAMLMEPAICERMVLVWLGGHAWHWGNTCEFNMRQDVAAARVVFAMAKRLVQLPCLGVVSHLALSRPEMEYWLQGKNALCDYLADAAIREAEAYAAGKPWTRVIWDVAAVAWLLNGPARMLDAREEPRPMPTYDHHYDFSCASGSMTYVYGVHRDAIFQDLFSKLTKGPDTP